MSKHGIHENRIQTHIFPEKRGRYRWNYHSFPKLVLLWYIFIDRQWIIKLKIRKSIKSHDPFYSFSDVDTTHIYSYLFCAIVTNIILFKLNYSCLGENNIQAETVNWDNNILLYHLFQMKWWILHIESEGITIYF